MTDDPTRPDDVFTVVDEWVSLLQFGFRGTGESYLQIREGS